MASMLPILQSPNNFLEDFIAQASVARRRVWIQAMVFEAGDVSERVGRVLIDAARRGCDVRFQIDWNSSQYVEGDLRLLPEFDLKRRAYAKTVHSRNERFLALLRREGITVNVLNTPMLAGRLLPIYRRNHTKIYIVDESAWMGGMNFYDEAFSNIDFMVRFTDERVVNPLSAQFEMVNEKRPKNNYSVQCMPGYTLLVDSGKHGDSIIYDEALNSIGSAKESIVFISQIVPEGVLLEILLKKSLVGIKIDILTSPRNENQFKKYPQKYFYDVFKKKVMNNQFINVTHLLNTVHAKLIIVDNKIALFGSHNFVEQGVLLGTEEICMKTEDPYLLSQLSAFSKL